MEYLLSIFPNDDLWLVTPRRFLSDKYKLRIHSKWTTVNDRMNREKKVSIFFRLKSQDRWFVVCHKMNRLEILRNSSIWNQLWKLFILRNHTLSLRPAAVHRTRQWINRNKKMNKNIALHHVSVISSRRSHTTIILYTVLFLLLIFFSVRTCQIQNWLFDTDSVFTLVHFCLLHVYVNKMLIHKIDRYSMETHSITDIPSSLLHRMHIRKQKRFGEIWKLCVHTVVNFSLSLFLDFWVRTLNIEISSEMLKLAAFEFSLSLLQTIRCIYEATKSLATCVMSDWCSICWK